MNARTIAELDLRRAQLAARAERLRQEQRSIPVLSPRAAFLARKIKAVQERADDYARIFTMTATETKELRRAS